MVQKAVLSVTILCGLQFRNCTYGVGVGALGLAGISFDQYDVTFGQYLNAALHDAGDCSLNTVPLNGTRAFLDGFSEGTLDFSFVDAGLFACLTVSLCA